MRDSRSVNECLGEIDWHQNRNHFRVQKCLETFQWKVQILPIPRVFASNFGPDDWLRLIIANCRMSQPNAEEREWTVQVVKIHHN
jgi:hypothetical protein